MSLSAMNRAGWRSRGLHERVFSISKARRALWYLQPVLTDAVDAFQRAQSAKNELNLHRGESSRDVLCERRDVAIARLNRTIDECHAVGVCMVNIAEGSLAMKVRHRRRLMCLIWRLGDPVQSAWSDLDEPQAEPQSLYAARQA